MLFQKVCVPFVKKNYTDRRSRLINKSQIDFVIKQRKQDKNLGALQKHTKISLVYSVCSKMTEMVLTVTYVIEC